MSPQPGSLVDPILRLFGPSGALIAFNDDAVSGTNPSATISDAVLDDPGTYTIEASAFLATTGVYRLQLDLVDPDAAWARFEIAPANGAAPLTVTTINDSANATSFTWDFDDGDTSTIAAPEHTFTEAGTFEVSLTACSGAVCDTASATISVEADDDGGEGRNARIAALVLDESGTYVIEAQAFPDTGLGEYELSLQLDPEPVIRARAEADVPALVVPVDVRFSDRSLGGPTSWSWTLDGSLLSREPGLTHRFEQPGSFVVSLEACNVRSCDMWHFQLAIGLDSDGGPIASRGTALGQIAPPGDHDDWQVSGVTGATLSAGALADDPSLELTLELLDPDGDSIAFDDDSAGDLNPRIVLALPRSGTYTLRVATFDDTLGGGYRLEVDLRAPARTSGQSDVLQAGWNLVSWPMTSAVEDVVVAIVGDIEAIYAWDAIGGEFLLYDPSLPRALNSLTQIEGGRGLWIRMAGPGAWQRAATDRTVFPLRAGFNLISWQSPAALSVDQAFSSIAYTLVAVYAWNPIAQEFLTYRPQAPAGFNTLQQLTPGQGLWLQVGDDVRWMAPSG